MSEPDRNEAVEKMIGNMTAEMQNNVDGQYNPLGFPPANEPLNWTHQPPQYNNYFHHPGDYVPMPQYTPQFGYVQPQFAMDEYKNLALNTLKYNLYESMQNDPGVFALLNPNLPQVNNNFGPNEPPQSASAGHLFENLVGNWAPNTSGTYSPFGEPFNPSVSLFEKPPEKENIPEQSHEHIEDKQQNIQFHKSNKPRMVAEVKPMRPSYSDVLTKSVPVTQAKPVKNDAKEMKIKNKDAAGKKVKTPKVPQRPEAAVSGEKITLKSTASVNSKEKRPRSTQLNRKWSSLDDIKETVLADKVEEKKKRSANTNASEEPVQKKAANVKKVTKTTTGDFVDDTNHVMKIDSLYVNKNGVKKVKSGTRQKNNADPSSDKNGKRTTRFRKRECNNIRLGVIGQKIKTYLSGWWKYFTIFLFWLIHLISDICSLSVHIGQYLATNTWQWFCIHWASLLDLLSVLIQRNRLLSWLWSKVKRPEKPSKADNNRSFLSQSGLKSNISMPTTGEEAMKRLQACKGKDPYSILGVTPGCSDDDIKKYYKRQAFLVHPDKNQQPGAEEAFKILVHAFDMIGEPERRAAYDKGVLESVQVEQAWTELNDLLTQLQEKVEAAANTIRCSACGSRHRRQRIDRPCYAARKCASCRIHHSAREGDIWAEARCFGFLWHYYACMDGAVYEITEWAACQKDSLKHLRPDSHQVQYRIALGSKQQQQQQRRHSGGKGSEKQPDLENLLNTLYGQADGAGKKKNKKSK